MRTRAISPVAERRTSAKRQMGVAPAPSPKSAAALPLGWRGVKGGRPSPRSDSTTRATARHGTKANNMLNILARFALAVAMTLLIATAFLLFLII